MNRNLRYVFTLVVALSLLASACSPFAPPPRGNNGPAAAVNPTSAPAAPTNNPAPVAAAQPVAPVAQAPQQTDVCLNISGAQSEVPSNMVADGKGNCVPIAPTPAPQPTSAPAAKPTNPPAQANTPPAAPTQAQTQPAASNASSSSQPASAAKRQPNYPAQAPAGTDPANGILCPPDEWLQATLGGDIAEIKPVATNVKTDPCKWLVKSLTAFWENHLSPDFTFVGASDTIGKLVVAFLGDGLHRHMYGSTIRYKPAYELFALKAEAEGDQKLADYLRGWNDDCTYLERVNGFGHDNDPTEDGVVRKQTYDTYNGNMNCPSYLLRLPQDRQVPVQGAAASAPAPAAPAAQAAAPANQMDAVFKDSAPNCPRTPEDAAKALFNSTDPSVIGRMQLLPPAVGHAFIKWKINPGSRLNYTRPGYGDLDNGEFKLERSEIASKAILSGTFNCRKDASQTGQIEHEDNVVLAFVPMPDMRFVRQEEDDLRIAA